MQIVESRGPCHNESGRLKMKQDEARLGRCTPRGKSNLDLVIFAPLLEQKNMLKD